jgi:pyrroloquinoline quinone biosynthesis protein E
MNDKPYGLLAELTYRCPLHCPYCSNPLKLMESGDELALEEWTRVLAEARELGVLQLHLSGGEPLQRRDLLDIVAQAHRLGFYTNLITSGLSLTPEKAEQLKSAGLDNVQVSIQAADPELSDRIAGTPSYHRKVAAARAVKALGFPLTLNTVLHRHNMDQVGSLIDLAEELGADRLELANTQYYGWALHNRAALMPTRAQLDRIEPVVRAEIARLAGRMQILYVFPDYYSPYPKPCMGGWGSRQLTVRPNGDVLPCQAADQIAGLAVENVRRQSLEWIWDDSPMFNRFRGQDWMQEPCRTCPRKDVDFGGCRCQAFLLTGDSAATDPVCHLSPQHAIVTDLIQAVSEVGAGGAGEAPMEFDYRWLDPAPVFSAPRA